MVRFWRSPNTKDAYRLSWVSLACTIAAAFVGLALYMVRLTHSKRRRLRRRNDQRPLVLSSVLAPLIFRFFLTAHETENGIVLVLDIFSRKLCGFFEFHGRLVEILCAIVT